MWVQTLDPNGNPNPDDNPWLFNNLLGDAGIAGETTDWTYDISPVPLPATLPLFASALGLMGLLGWRRKRKNAIATAAA